MHRVRTPNGFDTHLRQANMPYESSFDHIGDRTDRLLNWHRWIEPRRPVEINVIGTQVCTRNSNALFRVLAMYPPPTGASTAVNRANIPRSPAVVVNFHRPKHAIFAPSALIGEPKAERVHQPWPRPVWVKDQAAWRRSTRRAGARGGARVGRPRWARMRAITASSSMAFASPGLTTIGVAAGVG